MDTYQRCSLNEDEKNQGHIFSPLRNPNGSPYNIATLRLNGDRTPELPDESWQDVTAESPDGRFVGLVAWAISNQNNPGFTVYSIDTEQKSFSQFKRIRGYCKSIEWNQDSMSFEWQRFLH